MRWRKVRFKIGSIMIAIAMMAVALAVIEPLWIRPSPKPIDPFDLIDMTGPEPALPGRLLPGAVDPRNQFRQTNQEPTERLEGGIGQSPR